MKRDTDTLLYRSPTLHGLERSRGHWRRPWRVTGLECSPSIPAHRIGPGMDWRCHEVGCYGGPQEESSRGGGRRCRARPEVTAPAWGSSQCPPGPHSSPTIRRLLEPRAGSGNGNQSLGCPCSSGKHSAQTVVASWVVASLPSCPRSYSSRGDPIDYRWPPPGEKQTKKKKAQYLLQDASFTPDIRR